MALPFDPVLTAARNAPRGAEARPSGPRAADAGKPRFEPRAEPPARPERPSARPANSAAAPARPAAKDRPARATEADRPEPARQGARSTLADGPTTPDATPAPAISAAVAKDAAPAREKAETDKETEQKADQAADAVPFPVDMVLAATIVTDPAQPVAGLSDAVVASNDAMQGNSVDQPAATAASGGGIPAPPSADQSTSIAVAIGAVPALLIPAVSVAGAAGGAAPAAVEAAAPATVAPSSAAPAAAAQAQVAADSVAQPAPASEQQTPASDLAGDAKAPVLAGKDETAAAGKPEEKTTGKVKAKDGDGHLAAAREHPGSPEAGAKLLAALPQAPHGAGFAPHRQPGLDIAGPGAAAPGNTVLPDGAEAGNGRTAIVQAGLNAVPIEIGLKAAAGFKRIDIRLDPAELGRVDVRLDVSDTGEVKAQLVVDRVETLGLLQRDARTLERAFEQIGLKTGEQSIDLSLRNPGAQNDGANTSFNGGNGRDGGSARQGQGGAERQGAQPMEAPAMQWQRRSLGGVDVRV